MRQSVFLMKKLRQKQIFLILFFQFFLILPPLNSAEEKTFRVDFRDQEISDFLKAMSGIIGKNIMVDERVKGKITVISPKKISVTKAYQYMSTVLALKGFSIVDDGLLLKVIPLKDAVAKSPHIILGRAAIAQELVRDNEVVTHILPLYTAKASRLAGILKRITDANTDIIDFDENGFLIFTGGALEINRLVRITLELDPEEAIAASTEGSFGNIHIYRLENMQAEKIEATLRKISIPDNLIVAGQQQPGQPPVPVQQRQPGQKTDSKIDIVAHKESNSLIFMGSADEFEMVKELIKRIDLPRDQVLLEVLIVEVAADHTNSFGIDWKVNGPTQTAQFNTGIFGSSSITDVTKVLDVNTLQGFSLGFLDNSIPVGALIQANVNRDNFAIVSAPQVLTLDNQEAEINVGEDVPVVTANRKSGATADAVDYFTYEYKAVGVKVKFTPQINKNNLVTLDLYQEIKTISGYTEDVTKNPKFTKRDIKTSIRVEDNQTIVIGGLISTDKTKNMRKVPLLGDIPILGYLFKRQSEVIKRTNLLVFITPHVLSTRELADEATSKLNDLQLKEFKERGLSK